MTVIEQFRALEHSFDLVHVRAMAAMAAGDWPCVRQAILEERAILNAVDH